MSSVKRRKLDHESPQEDHVHVGAKGKKTRRIPREKDDSQHAVSPPAEAERRQARRKPIAGKDADRESIDRAKVRRSAHSDSGRGHSQDPDLDSQSPEGLEDVSVSSVSGGVRKALMFSLGIPKRLLKKSFVYRSSSI